MKPRPTLPNTAKAQQVVEPPRVREARRFLARRGIKPGGAFRRLPHLPQSTREIWGTQDSHRRRIEKWGTDGLNAADPSANAGTGAVWTAVGPVGVVTPSYGVVTGRIAAIALDPADATGNTVFLGTTGGGVWKSQNGAASVAGNVQFSPVTDGLGALSGVLDSGVSIGALTVQPGGTGVVLAGTGDPNDALDSYYGAGLLRSTDGGQTWTLIQHSMDQESGLALEDYWFSGLGFAGFAWRSSNAQTVVAAVSQAYEGTLVGAGMSGGTASESYTGLYASTDGGATWHVATVTDPNGLEVQGPNAGLTGLYGNAATAVVWNPVRQLFVAAIRFHGYYQSPDGMSWVRMANQPGGG